MSAYLETLLLLLLLNEKASNTNLTVFGLTRLGPHSTIYRIRDYNANRYTTIAVGPNQS
jgi:hypothetical protein